MVSSLTAPEAFISTSLGASLEVEYRNAWHRSPLQSYFTLKRSPVIVKGSDFFAPLPLKVATCWYAFVFAAFVGSDLAGSLVAWPATVPVGVDACCLVLTPMPMAEPMTAKPKKISTPVNILCLANQLFFSDLTLSSCSTVGLSF